jgi:hypothetical protein
MAGGARLPNELKPQTKCAIWLNRERCYADWSAEPWSGVWQILQSLTSDVDVTKGVATAGTRLGERIGAAHVSLANAEILRSGKSAVREPRPTGASEPLAVPDQPSPLLVNQHQFVLGQTLNALFNLIILH